MKEIIEAITKHEYLKTAINLGSLSVFLTKKKSITLEYVYMRYFEDTIEIFGKSKLFHYETIPLSESEFVLFLGRDKVLLQEFVNKFREYIHGNNENLFYIWEALWFPECCTRSFYDFFKGTRFEDLSAKMYPFFLKIANNSPRSSRYLDVWSEHRLIFHSPCSFDCQESIRMAMETEQLLEKEWLDFGIRRGIHTLLYFPSNDFIVDSDWKYEFWFYYSGDVGNNQQFRLIQTLLGKSGFRLEYSGKTTFLVGESKSIELKNILTIHFS